MRAGGPEPVSVASLDEAAPAWDRCRPAPLRQILALVVGGALAVGAAGCGQKGRLQAPASAVAPAAAATPPSTGPSNTASKPRPVAGPPVAPASAPSLR